MQLRSYARFFPNSTCGQAHAVTKGFGLGVIQSKIRGCVEQHASEAVWLLALVLRWELWVASSECEDHVCIGLACRIPLYYRVHNSTPNPLPTSVHPKRKILPQPVLNPALENSYAPNPQSLDRESINLQDLSPKAVNPVSRTSL